MHHGWTGVPRFPQDFTKCDFGRIREYLEEKKKLKNAHRKGVITSTEESELAKVAKAKKDVEEAKKEKEALLHKYGFAIVGNDHIEKVRVLPRYAAQALVMRGLMPQLGNTTIEPPGLFRGRGEHPKMGSLKQRVMPEDITINIAKGAPVPKCPLPGHNWKSVVHDPSVTWLAYWRENVMGSFKYVFLAASSSFKGKSDMAKYDKVSWK